MWKIGIFQYSLEIADNGECMIFATSSVTLLPTKAFEISRKIRRN